MPAYPNKYVCLARLDIVETDSTFDIQLYVDEPVLREIAKFMKTDIAPPGRIDIATNVTIEVIS